MADDAQPTEGSRRKVGLIVGVVAVVILGLFVFQNTDDVRVEFLWMDGEFPLFLLLFITIALTVVVSILGAWILNRRSKRS